MRGAGREPRRGASPPDRRRRPSAGRGASSVEATGGPPHGHRLLAAPAGPLVRRLDGGRCRHGGSGGWAARYRRRHPTGLVGRSASPYAVPYRGGVGDNVLPPGESGFVIPAGYAAGNPGPDFSNQLSLHTSFGMRPFGFSAPGTPTMVDGARVFIGPDGTPRIYAPSIASMEYAAGYETGRLRLFQIEVLRGAAEGKLAAILGPSELTADETVRQLGSPRSVLMAQFDALPRRHRRRRDGGCGRAARQPARRRRRPVRTKVQPASSSRKAAVSRRGTGRPV